MAATNSLRLCVEICVEKQHAYIHMQMFVGFAERMMILLCNYPVLLL